MNRAPARPWPESVEQLLPESWREETTTPQLQRILYGLLGDSPFTESEYEQLEPYARFKVRIEIGRLLNAHMAIADWMHKKANSTPPDEGRLVQIFPNEYKMDRNESWTAYERVAILARSGMTLEDGPEVRRNFYAWHRGYQRKVRPALIVKTEAPLALVKAPVAVASTLALLPKMTHVLAAREMDAIMLRLARQETLLPAPHVSAHAARELRRAPHVSARAARKPRRARRTSDAGIKTKAAPRRAFHQLNPDALNGAVHVPEFNMGLDGVYSGVPRLLGAAEPPETPGPRQARKRPFESLRVAEASNEQQDVPPGVSNKFADYEFAGDLPPLDNAPQTPASGPPSLESAMQRYPLLDIFGGPVPDPPHWPSSIGRGDAALLSAGAAPSGGAGTGSHLLTIGATVGFIVLIIAVFQVYRRRQRTVA